MARMKETPPPAALVTTQRLSSAASAAAHPDVLRAAQTGETSSGRGRGPDERTLRRAGAAAVLLTFKEAMDFLRVSRSTIYRLMWSGQLRGHKVGSTWRFYESDLLAAVATPGENVTPKRPPTTAEGQG